MKINRRIVMRATALIALASALSIASSRLSADTGTCGGAGITLPFVDVAAGNVFFCSIAEAYFSGLANGTDATHYNPAGNVPREQMAAFVTRTLDQSLKRGSRRGALDQWAIPTSVPFTAKTTVGNNPNGVKSDGEDLWVANITSSTVSRVHASDGKLLQTWTGVSFAESVVVARGRVFVLGNASTGIIYVIDPTQPAGSVPQLANLGQENAAGLAFDGFNLWTTCFPPAFVSKVNPNTSAVTNFTGFTKPTGVMFDGSNIWVTNDDPSGGQLIKIDSNANVLQTVSVGHRPGSPIYDGTNIWVPNEIDDTVTVIRASTGVVLATLSNNGLASPGAAAFDGERVLITNGSTVSLWKASDLSPLGVFSGATSVARACSDGLNFWLTLQDGTPGNPGHLVRF